MNIFKWIIEYLRNLFRIPPKEQERNPGGPEGDSIGPSLDEIRSEINEKIEQKEPISTTEISELAESLTAAELKELIATPIKKGIRVFDSVEIEQEVTALNKKLIELQIKNNQIEPNRFLQIYSTDKDIEELERILQEYDNKQNLVFTIQAREKLKSRFGHFDKFLQERKLVTIYRIREEKRKKEEETKKQQVKELIGRIENLINQGNLQETQSQLAKAANSIASLRNPDQRKRFREKLETLKAKFRDRQVREEAKRQAEELKKQQEEAELKRLAEEAKREEERKRREQAELIRKQQEEAQKKKEEEKRQALQRLLTKKSDWPTFEQVLQTNEITTLYHFTDRDNIASIKKNGGLYSWQYCDKNGISIPVSGGDPLSRNLDVGQGLQDFVRLSFISDHPMMHVALRDRRIFNPVILKVSLEVAYFENTRFSNMNAADKKSCNSTELSFFKNLRFDLFKQSYFNLEGMDKKHYQSEVMVKTWIPIEFITNINQF